MANAVMVLPEAAVVTTPLHPHNWLELLSAFPDKDLIEFFINGLLHGFKIGFNNPLSQLFSARKNPLGALQHPQVMDDYLKAEIAEHRVTGPCSSFSEGSEDDKIVTHPLS